MPVLSVPVALTIAGSDSGGGAGVQADLKTFAAHRVYGVSVITLVTAQNTLGVRAVQRVTPDLVAAQLHAVLEDFPVRAVKTGALGDAGIIEVVADVLRGRGVPLVVDPVMVSTSGARLLDADAVEVLRTRLLPLATLVTPNLPEAEVLLGLPGGVLREPQMLERTLAQPLPYPLLLKGGHGEGDVLRDHLLLAGERVTLSASRQGSRHTHGTGCTLASAITANLARGVNLREAVRGAHAYLQRAIRAAPGLGRGAGPLEHFPDDGTFEVREDARSSQVPGMAGEATRD